MGDLTGTWNIYSQKIGDHAVFTARSTSVEIDENNKSEGGFALKTAEPVSFGSIENGYYLAESCSYRYRAHIHESDGLKLLVGHVATIQEYPVGHPYANPHRCVFVGMSAPKGPLGSIDNLQLPMVRIPLFHNYATRHRSGTIDLSRTGGTVLLNGTNPRPFQIKKDEVIEEGIHIVSEKSDGKKIDTLEAWVIFGPGSRPIFVGYHNWKDNENPAELLGPPTSERCTKGIVG